MEQELEDFLSLASLPSLKPPYLAQTFTKYRACLFKHYNSEPEFIEKVDGKYLTKFMKKVRKAYIQFNLDTGLTCQELGISLEFLNDLSHRDELMQLVSIISRWSTEIELAVDILDRAKLYGLYEVPKDLQQIYQELKSQWGTSDESLLSRGYRFLLKTLAYSTNRGTDFVKAKISGIVTANLAQSKSVIISSVFYAYISGMFPWTLLAVMGTQMSWMLSGWLITRFGHQIGEKLDSAQVAYHLNEFRQHLEPLVADLTYKNDTSYQLILQARDSEEGREALQAHLNGVIMNKPVLVQEAVQPLQQIDAEDPIYRFASQLERGVVFQEDFDEDVYIAENVIIKEEGEWLVIDPPAVAIVDDDDAWVIIDST